VTSDPRKSGAEAARDAIDATMAVTPVGVKPIPPCEIPNSKRARLFLCVFMLMASILSARINVFIMHWSNRERASCKIVGSIARVSNATLGSATFRKRLWTICDDIHG
jgi:hypothetical protein